jgi:hypothetical protein
LFTRSDTKKYLDPNDVNNQLTKRSALLSTERQQILVFNQSSVTLLTGDDVEALNFPVWRKLLNYIGKVGA